MKIRQLCSMLYIDQGHKNTLKKVLTHRSYYVEEPEAIGNSRYVFKGQYVFKAKLAEVLLNYVPGNGLQLQNTLGKLMSQDFLKQNVYDAYQLENWIKLNKDYKRPLDHIFCYALLGFLNDVYTPKQLNNFIVKTFIEKGEHIIYARDKKNRDVKSQFMLLCKQYYNCKPSIDLTETQQGFTAYIKLKGVMYASSSSKSLKYVNKKVFKQALKKITQEMELERMQDEEYVQKLERQKAIERAAKEKAKTEEMNAYFKKRAQRSQEISERKAEQKILNKEKDKKRRIAQERAKERKALMEKRQKLKEMGLQNISSAKRRILEDKGVLPKRK